MPKTKKPTNVFNPALFGEQLRTERRKAGFSNTKLLSKAIKKQTGVFIDFDTLMKYERGEREPDVTKLVAISFTLYQEKWLSGMNNLIMLSIPLTLKKDEDNFGTKVFAAAQGYEEEKMLEQAAIRRKSNELEYLLKEAIFRLNEANTQIKMLNEKLTDH